MTLERVSLRRGAWIGLEATALIGLLLLSHLLLDLEPHRIPDFGLPDALFYSRGAESLAAGRGYTLEINGVSLPPKFPPGTSVLLAAGYAGGGKERGDGLRMIHLLAGLLGLLTWAGARRLGGPWAGLGALAALQGSWYLTACRNQMASDIPACLVPLGVALLLARPGPGWGRLFAAGLLAGFGLWLRYPLISLAPCLLLLIDPRRRGLANRTLAIGLGALLPVSALLVWQWAAFGAPFRTGYSLWLPDFHQAARAVFSLEYALESPALGAMKGPNWSYYGAILAGRGSMLYTWPVALAALVGLPFLLARDARPEARRVVGFSLLFVLCNYILYTVYFFQEARLLLPLVPLLCVLAGAGAAAAVGRCGRRIQALAPLAPLLLVPAVVPILRQAATQGERFIMLEKSLGAEEVGRLVPPGSIVLTGRDLLLVAREAPRAEILPLTLRQEWTDALAWRDRRRARPEEDGAATAAWVATLDARSLPPEEARAMLAPPLAAAFDYLLQEAARARPLFLEGGGKAWELLEPHFRRERIASPLVELWRLVPIE